MTNSKAASWIITTVIDYRRAISVLVLTHILCGILSALQPRYYQQLVTIVIEGPEGGILGKGLSVIGILAVLYIAVALLLGFGGYIGTVFSANLLKDLQVRFFEKSAQLPLSYFHNQSSGELFTKFNTDVGMAQRFIGSIVPDFFRELVTASCVIVILLYSCPFVLTAAALAIAFTASLAIIRLNRFMSAYAGTQRQGWSAINRTFDETVRGIDTLKILNAERHVQKSFLHHTAAFRNVCIRAGSIVAAFSPAIDLLTKLGSLIPLLLAYYLISGDSIELEAFLLFLFYGSLLNISLANLTAKLANIQNEIISIRSLAAFFTEQTEPDEPAEPTPQITSPVPVRISGLSFSYPGCRPLYRNANLHIAEKSITLLQGESGSGKSTLINILLKFYAFQEGTVTIGPTNISQLAREELRSKIGVITQNHFIFQESLRKNLLVAKPDADDTEITQALEFAQLSDFLSRAADGLDTVMGYQGNDCSGGEKQRICLARLLLRRSPIMILDEPFSNIDLQARSTLAHVLNNWKQNATILILSHDTTPDLSVDRSYRLDGSRGIFEELF